MNLCAAMASLCMSAGAFAGPMTLSFGEGYSVEGLGHFSGTMTWSYVSGTSGTLTISLTNLLTTSAGGKITGLGFNGPSGGGFSYALASAPNASWLLDTAPVTASPLGSFGFGAALGGDWSGGGSPNGGIVIGDTGLFEFTVSNSDTAALAALDAMSFWNPNDEGYFGAIRFKGFDNGGSDKITTELSVVPIPAPAFLAAGGLLFAALLRRRSK